MLEKNELSCGLVGKYVDIYEFADGRLDVRWKSVFPAPIRLRQGAARHAHGDHREQAARRSADLDQGSAGRGAAGRRRSRPTASRAPISSAERKPGRRTDFMNDPAGHRAARTGTGKVGCGQVKTVLKAKAEGASLERTRSGCATPNQLTPDRALASAPGSASPSHF